MVLTEKRTLWLSIALYSLLAFGLSTWLLQFGYFIGHDGVWYVRIAKNIIAGKGISVNVGVPYVDHPPFYPLLIGIANLCFKDLELSGHLVSILAFSLTVIPLFFLTKAIYGGETPHWVSLLFATNGFLLIHSNLVLAESLFVLLVMIQIYLVHQVIQGERGGTARLGILMGILAGITYLTRPEGLLFYLAGILSISLLAPQSHIEKNKLAALSFVTFLIFLVPYLTFIYRNTHRIQLSGAITEIFVKRQLDVARPGQYLETAKIYEGLTSDKTRLKLDELKEKFNLIHYLVKDHFALLKSGFGSMIWRLLELSKYLFGGIGFLFVGASLLSVPWDQKRRKSELLLLIFLLTVVPQLFGIFHPKRFFLYLPFFLIWMGNGIEVLRNWARQSFHLSEKASLIVAFGACSIFILASAWYLEKDIKNDPTTFEYKEMGTWMKNNIPRIEEERVASQHPSVIFYSGAKILNPPYLPYVDRFEDFLTYMAYQQAKYFVVSESLELPALESYRFLLDETKPLPPGISRKHTVKAKKKTILYEILNQKETLR